MVIQHNMHAMFSQRQLGITTKDKAKSQEKLSSGYKINRAADNAAGLAISEKMRKQIRGLERGMQNTTEGISFVQIADGAMNEVHDMIHRISELAIQAANGTNSEGDRKAIDAEVQQIKKEINRIGETTKYNEIRIFDQEYAAPSFTMHGRYYALEDINMYNATYDAETGKVTYGGMILNGERVSWDSINPNMVNVDADGNQTFVGGDYTFSFHGSNYKIHCDDGAAVPQIKREFDFKGTPEFLYLGKNRYNWSDFVDDNGYALSMYTLHEGTWTRKGSTDTIELDFVQRQDNYADLADIQAAAADGLIPQPKVLVEERWSQAVATDAMDMVEDTRDGLKRGTSVTKENITSNDQMDSIMNAIGAGKKGSYRLRADKENDGKDPAKTGDYKKNGVWLEEWKTVYKYDDAGDKIPVISGYDPDGNPVQATDSSGNPLWEKESRWVMVPGSLQTWSQVGLQDDDGAIWNSGTDVRAAKEAPVVYQYSDSGTTVGFSFVIDAEVTSLDSIIDGIDESMVFNRKLDTSYVAEAEFTPDDNILDSRFSMSTSNEFLLSAEEEYKFGRDYSQQTVDSVASGDVGISNGTSVVRLANAAGTQWIDLKGNDVTSQINKLSGDADDLVEFVEKKKISAILRGDNPDAITLEPDSFSLKDVVGSGNYTDTGKLNLEITFDSSFTNQTSGGHGKLPDSSEYPVTLLGATINFQSIGTSKNLYDLIGTGFDSTCATCYEHYSVLFSWGDADATFSSVKSDYDGNKDLKYKVTSSSEEFVKSDGSNSIRTNYLLNVDLSSFADAGITTGEQLVHDLVNVLDGPANATWNQQLDTHYTQFASKDSTLYVIEPRAKNDTYYWNICKNDPDYALFFMEPHASTPPATQGDYNFNMNDTSGNRTTNLGYTYDFTDIKDNVKVEMAQLNGASANEAALKAIAEDGKDYVYEKKDGKYIKYTKSYSEYKSEKARASLDPSDPNYQPWTEPTLYKVNVAYKQGDGSYAEGNAAKIAMQKSYATDAVKEMLENTKIKLNATDYTKVTWGVDDKPSTAMDSRFETTVNVSGYGRSKGVKIQHSSHTRDWTYIPQFTLNTFALGIYRADCTDEMKATLTIDLTNRALKAVSYRRSVYGAIQNALEHTYNNRYNTMENTQAAESRLRDTDMAKEISKYSKHSILEQAGQSMLAQANQSTNGILSLLQ